MYFCTAKMKRNLLPSKPVEVVLDVNESFGCTTDYYLFLVRSELDPLSFAQQCTNLFGADFAFLCNFSLSAYRDIKVKIPAFTALIRPQQNLTLTFIPNWVLTDLSDETDQYTLSIPMFREQFYFLGNTGLFKYKCPYDEYDFVILISVDKECSVEDVRRIIHQQTVWKSQEITDLLYAASNEPKPVHPAKSKSKGKAKKAEEEPLDVFLKGCCMEILTSIERVYKSRRVRYLGQRHFMPDVNYVHQYKSIFQLLQQQENPLLMSKTRMLDSDNVQKLLLREDV